MVDEELLEQVTRLLGHKSYSAAINFSLAETLRQAKLKDLWSFVGSGVWEGSLAAMRGDREAVPPASGGKEKKASRSTEVSTKRPRGSRAP